MGRGGRRHRQAGFEKGPGSLRKRQGEIHPAVRRARLVVGWALALVSPLLLVVAALAQPAEAPSPRPVPSAADGRFDGDLWQAAGPAGIGAPVALAVDPKRADLVYLATADGLYMTRDGGRGWTVTALPGVMDFALHPGDPRRLALVTDDGNGLLRLWRSTDRGESWQPGAEVRSAASGKATVPRASDLVWHPSNPNLLYLTGTLEPRPRATPGGGAPAADPPEPGSTAAGDAAGRRVPGDRPTPLGRLWVSHDGGQSLTERPLPEPLVPSRMLARRDGTLFAATAEGVWRSVDEGRTWLPARSGLEARRTGTFRSILRLAASPDDPDLIFAGAAASGGPAGPGRAVSLFRTDDGGDHWTAMGAEVPAGAISDLVVDPGDRRSLWVTVAGAGIHTTRGGPWQPITPDLPDDAEAHLLAVASDLARTLWVATPSGDLFRRSPPPPPCVDDATTLCLAGRFRIDVEWRDEDPTLAIRSRRAGAVPLTQDGGWFWFARPEQPEVAVKAIRGTHGAAADGDDGPSGSTWTVYATGLSSAGFDLRIFDVESGRFQTFRPPPGETEGAAHVATFPAAVPTDAAENLWFAALPEGGCGGDSIDLCLHEGRFQVQVDWYDGADGSGAAIGDRLSDAAGWFRFLQPGEPEALVAVIDGRRSNGHWWVVFGALTDLGFDLTVTDRVSGETLAYGVEAGEATSHRDLRAFAEDPPP